MGLLRVTVSLAFVSLFAIAVISFMTGYANDNNVAIDLADDSDLTGLVTTSKTNMGTFTNATRKAGDSISNSTVGTEDDAARIGSIPKNTPLTLLNSAKNILNVGGEKIFGDDDTFAIILTTFGTILGIILTLYIIKTIRTGNPD